MYLPPTAVTNLLKTLSTSFPKSRIVIYDAIVKDDIFGNVMCKNLENAGVNTEGLRAVSSLKDQENRVRDCGFNFSVRSCTMLQVYDNLLSGEQRRKANRIEMLDEMEEWNLIMGHYCFVVGDNFEEEGSTCSSSGD